MWIKSANELYNCEQFEGVRIQENAQTNTWNVVLTKHAQQQSQSGAASGMTATALTAVSLTSFMSRQAADTVLAAIFDALLKGQPGIELVAEKVA